MMLATFGATGVAKCRANTAELLCPVTAQAHQLCRSITGGGTFHIQLDAAGHHFYIFFLCTGRGAVVANGGTTQTGVYAVFVFVVSCHIKVFGMVTKPGPQAFNKNKTESKTIIK